MKMGMKAVVRKTDDGKVQVKILDLDGEDVVIAEFTPDTAKRLAGQIIRAAFIAEGGGTAQERLPRNDGGVTMFFERATEHAASDLCRSITTIVDAIRMGRLEVEVENKTHGRKRIRLVRYDDE